jgi:hypothetical protein
MGAVRNDEHVVDLKQQIRLGIVKVYNVECRVRFMIRVRVAPNIYHEPNPKP